MRTKTHPPIAAFCARNREIGYVLMLDGRIIHYGVKTIKGKRKGKDFIRRVTRTLQAVLERLTPRCLVVVEDLSHRTKPGAVNQAIHALETEWTRKQLCRVTSLSLRDVKHSICSDHTVAHRVLAETIVTRYPPLAGLRCDFAIYRPLYWELVCLAAALADTAEKPLG